MKKLGKLNLLKNAEVLKGDEMKLIKGGFSDFRCCCGMGYSTGPCFTIWADSASQASAQLVAGGYCSYGGGCFL
ncbi:hypothetical protein [Bacteroides sp. 519]|uniref:hypothetical protein n=1 Tax=Bacteroides sp. 519 TaxID=2302937 RepID=UPI0013D12012|nr:hypothetical protein [Bacteroides sp. 519]NDV57147.1 hypothetical protein [Bacteroides sp. 519]